MTCHLVLCLSQKTMWTLSFFSGGGGSVTNDISFHARVGRFSPFLYLRSVALLYLWSVAIAVILFWLHLVVLVSPCFLGSRISRDYRFPRAPLSSVVSESRRSDDRQLKLQFGDRQTRVKTVHYYSEDRNSRCDAT